SSHTLSLEIALDDVDKISWHVVSSQGSQNPGGSVDPPYLLKILEEGLLAICTPGSLSDERSLPEDKSAVPSCRVRRGNHRAHAVENRVITPEFGNSLVRVVLKVLPSATGRFQRRDLSSST
ncbi:hypothetical protein FOL46_000602, partial [Perkinsus olseni]